MGRVLAGLCGALLLLPLSQALAQPCATPPVGQLVGTFTADGTLDAERLNNMQYLVDFIGAGTGSVAMTAQMGPGSPFITPVVGNFQAILGTAGATCTADCAMRLLADFSTVRFTMTTCTGCNVAIWTYGCER